MPGKSRRKAPEARTRLNTRAKRLSCVPEWIADAAAKSPRMLLCGWGKLLIENCGMVVLFTPSRIVLQTTIGRIEITGEGLELNALRADALIVSGLIRSLCSEGENA